ncbi:MAG TPA: maleylacetate reductase [Propionibacteriaceae bacterium]|nr:maleylacetate reductase [Propionibacteriaceae bacterium]
MRSFVSDDAAQRVVFGVGTLTTVGAEIDRLFVRRVVVLSTPGHAHLADRVAELLEGRAVGRFAGAVPHTPIEVTTRAVDLVRDLGGDGVVSVGGGSTTGLGKAVASRLGVPHLVVPTTYAGSERTPVLGETSGGAKTTRSDPAILPDAVLYDVDLTATLPWSVTVTSAVNAMAHAVEALYSNQATERTDAMALDAIRSLDHGLHAERANLDDLDGRSDLLYGAYLAGGCLGAVGMGLHHKLCHTLGGAFNLPHAPTHTVVLPYAMAYNEPAAAVAMDRIAAVMHSDHAPTAVQSLVRELGGPTALRDIGFAAVDIPAAADLAVSDSYPNPREVTRTGVIELLSRALNGDPVLRTDGKTSA